MSNHQGIRVAVAIMFGVLAAQEGVHAFGLGHGWGTATFFLLASAMWAYLMFRATGQALSEGNEQ